MASQLSTTIRFQTFLTRILIFVSGCGAGPAKHPGQPAPAKIINNERLCLSQEGANRHRAAPFAQSICRTRMPLYHHKCRW
ncbi:hypothetical protein BGY98DRAFT_959353 [Russula aff. rugulosa BPL654]|nr:hypothetical protein BGY98DRAFT_959353 [Russula aff. rugulosa BPL654]